MLTLYLTAQHELLAQSLLAGQTLSVLFWNRVEGMHHQTHTPLSPQLGGMSKFFSIIFDIIKRNFQFASFLYHRT